MRPKFWKGLVLGLTVLMAALVLWFSLRGIDRVPRPIRIASGSPTGLNRELIGALADQLERRGYPTLVLTTGGSIENSRLLHNREAEMVVIKAGTVDLQDLEVVAPLHQDAVLLIVRLGRGIRDISGLAGKRILVGHTGSGTLEVARRLLSRHGLNEGRFQVVEQHYTQILEDATADGAIVSTGLTSPELLRVMSTGQFEVLPVDDARALAMLNPFFFETTIPRGLYSANPPVPAQDTPTLSTWALLMTRPSCSPKMVGATLQSLYDNALLTRFPMLMPRGEAATWAFPPLHLASQSFYDPYKGLGIAANMLESLSALKELCVALAALLWLAWQRYRSAAEAAKQTELKQHKERLDVFVDETIKLEEELLQNRENPDVLRRLFEEVTRLKLRALSEMTHEELRTDRGFTVLMTQCRDLVEKIQRCQMIQHSQSAGEPETVEKASSS